MELAAIVWIDTEGTFKIRGYRSVEQASLRANLVNESGYPCVVITRQELIDGDLKSNAQLEDEADES